MNLAFVSGKGDPEPVRAAGHEVHVLDLDWIA